MSVGIAPGALVVDSNTGSSKSCPCPNAVFNSPNAEAPRIPVERVAELSGRLERELAKVIVGQQRVIREILIAFLAGGHCLLRGVPGLAKTLLIKKLAEAVDLKFNRIQFTPDLMPSDITGAEVIEEDRATGKRVIRFIRGPIFANIVLADEINRTPPKTQAALLEAMQERQVTVTACAPRSTGRSSCSRPRTRSNRKARIRSPRPSSIASCSTS